MPSPRSLGLEGGLHVQSDTRLSHVKMKESRTKRCCVTNIIQTKRLLSEWVGEMAVVPYVPAGTPKGQSLLHTNPKLCRGILEERKDPSWSKARFGKGASRSDEGGWIEGILSSPTPETRQEGQGCYNNWDQARLGLTELEITAYKSPQAVQEAADACARWIGTARTDRALWLAWLEWIEKQLPAMAAENAAQETSAEERPVRHSSTRRESIKRRSTQRALRPSKVMNPPASKDSAHKALHQRR